MSITARKLKDGVTVYDVRYQIGHKPDGTPNRVQVTCRTKNEAKLIHARMIAESDALRGRAVGMTLNDFVAHHYWPNATKRLAATTLDTYKKELDLRILPALGKYQLRAIDRAKIQALLSTTATAGVARKTLGVLKTILYDAQGYGLIMSNPATAPYTMPPAGTKRDNSLVINTFEEIYQLLNCVAQRANKRLYKLCLLGLLEGMRPEERYALRWADVDTANGVIKIRRAYTAASSTHGGNALKKPKTENGNRVIPIHNKLAEFIEKDCLVRQGYFVTCTNTPIAPSTAQHAWSRFIMANEDLPPVTLENMRHSFATSYLHAGGNIEDLSRILGHADISTTLKRYVKPDISSLVAGMRHVSRQ